MELVHAGELIIDDIEDESPMRRELASVHRDHLGNPHCYQWGNSRILHFRYRHALNVPAPEPSENGPLSSIL